MSFNSYILPHDKGDGYCYFRSLMTDSMILISSSVLMDGKLNEYLHDVDEECHERIELLVEEMKVGAGITEELKASAPVKWVGLMNNVRRAAEEAVIRELIYV